MLKRILLTLMGLVFALGQICANGVYSAKLKAVVSSESTGEGKVYASKKNSDANGEYSSTESVSDTLQTSNGGTTLYFYAFAKWDDGKTKFEGWTDENGKLLSTEKKYKVGVKAPENVGQINEGTVFATFRKRVNTTITIVPVDGVTYSVTDGSQTINSGTITTSRDLTLSATIPDGYKVAAWYMVKSDGGREYFAYEESVTKLFDESASVGVEIVDEDTPIFVIKGKNGLYFDLTEANEKAEVGDVIVLVGSGTLASGNYRIKEGVTLLIPYDDEYRYVKDDNITGIYRGQYTYLVPSVYNTLRMERGAVLNVDGGLSVSAVMNVANGGSVYPCGGVTNTYGLIRMETGSKINLNSGSTTYVWGYIIGDGEVDALKGSTVYEGFEITDFRGGTAISAIKDNEQKVFPLGNYYVQNIEVPITFHKGATEKVITALWAAEDLGSSNAVVHFCPAISYIGDNGLFRLKADDATITKYYNPSRDRQCYKIDGDAELADILFEVSEGELDSKDYVLPLVNNMSITIEDGTLKVKNENGLAVPADMELTIKEDATLEMGNGSMFVYDKDDWGEFACYQKVAPLTYTPTMAYRRTYENMSDAKVDIQGTLKFTGSGNIYTTEHNANVCSTGGKGKIVMTNGAGTKTETYQVLQPYVGKGTATEFVTIPITPAKLYNEKTNTYTSTASAKEGTTYYYVHGRWQTAPMPGGSLLGDVDCDGDIDVDDVETLAKKLAGMNPEPYNNLNADVDNNGRLSVRDVVKLVEKLR